MEVSQEILDSIFGKEGEDNEDQLDDEAEAESEIDAETETVVESDFRHFTSHNCASRSSSRRSALFVHWPVSKGACDFTRSGRDPKAPLRSWIACRVCWHGVASIDGNAWADDG